MRVASCWFYFLGMPLFMLEAWLCARLVPFYKNLKQKEAQSGRVSSIDGLRGVLAMSVFFLHCVEYYDYRQTGKWLPPKSNFYAQLGVASVTMFFFITGYVFWKKLKKKPDSIHFGEFLKERLRRLSGAYVLACLLLFLLVAISSSFKLHVGFGTWIMQHVLWLTFLGSGHEINRIPMSKVWLGPAWTLRSEWYFYLTLPLLGFFARTRRRLLLLLVGAAVVATLLGQVHVSGIAAALVELPRAYAMFLAYLFGTGMVIAELQVSRQTFARTHRLACLVAVVLIGVTLVYIKPEYGLLESAALALPFALVASGADVLGLLSSSPILFLGRVSYSFYLLHLLVLGGAWMFVDSVLPITSGAGPYWAFCAVAGTIALGLSAVSYRYIEAPGMRRAGHS